MNQTKGTPQLLPLLAVVMAGLLISACGAVTGVPQGSPTPNHQATEIAHLQATRAAELRERLEDSVYTATPVPSSTATPTPVFTLAKFTPEPTTIRTVVPADIPTQSDQSADSLPNMIEKIRSGVVRIETLYDDSSIGSGSGIIFETLVSDSSAFILTNYHVIEAATQIDIIVNDEKSYSGRVVGVDAVRDLAVLKICCNTNFEALPFGDSASLKVGTEVIAVGYPVWLSSSATVTRGIVSRFEYESDKERRIIQTDTPINPGNSGGPLFSINGDVMGINTFKTEYTSEGRPVEGIGFAIAESTVNEQLPALMAGGMRTFPTPTPTLTPTPNSQAAQNTYSNHIYDYSVNIASEWDVYDTDKSDVSIEKFGEFAYLRILSGENINYDSDQMLDTALEVFERGSHYFELLERSELILDSNVTGNAAVFRWEVPDRDCMQQTIYIAVVVNSLSYQLIGTSCEYAWYQHQSDLAYMVNSFDTIGQ